MRSVFYVFGTVLGLLCMGRAEKSSDDSEEGKLSIYKIEGLDFENTLVKKVCLLAQFNATIEISHTSTDGTRSYSVPIPQDAKTDGSFCNMEYLSELILHFDGNTLGMTFHRNTRHLLVPEKTTYCDRCDYGTWNVTQLHVKVHVEDHYNLHASVTPELMRQHAHELAEGVHMKRAYKCEESDRLTVIPMHVGRVVNTSNDDRLPTESWSVTIVFHLIQVQPFLVFLERFNDPYLCRDITMSLCLIILLPLFYFFVYILFYRIKAGYGCPPKCSESGSKPLKSLSESDTCLEESTNMPSGFSSGMQLGIDNSSAAYC